MWMKCYSKRVSKLCALKCPFKLLLFNECEDDIGNL